MLCKQLKKTNSKFIRILHHPLLYKYIHKKHHQWTSPIAITAVYCHPLEHLLSNTIPPVLVIISIKIDQNVYTILLLQGPTLMSSHLAVSWLWYSIAIITTLNDHSGYHFPGFRSPEAHDYHHLKVINCKYFVFYFVNLIFIISQFTECYGVLGILDFLHGTDRQFRSSAPYRRHTMFWSLEPIRKRIPDGPSNNNIKQNDAKRQKTV